MTNQDVLDLLNAETDAEWVWEHTGGGCMAIASYRGEHRVLLTDAEGPLVDLDENGIAAWIFGVYDGEDEIYIDSLPEDMVDRAREALDLLRRLRPSSPVLSPAVGAIVRFCAIECELQRSGERSVGWMVDAWLHAEAHVGPLTAKLVIEVGSLVDPIVNEDGLRTVGVRVGRDVKVDWKDVPRQLDNLVEAQGRLAAAEWFRAFEDIHPFRDGNGRTGVILFNLLNGTLHDPLWAPNFWGDPRRVPGYGV